MIIARTPLRISFLGGGTDYPDYYRVHGGETLATSINYYTMVTVNRLTRFADHRFRLHYSALEAARHVDEIKHPSARECLRFLGVNESVEIHYINDLPARTGLGSSSSATVSLLHALHAFKGEMVGLEQLANEAIYVEQECVKEQVGSQDQWICAQGGLRRFIFCPDGRIRSEPIALPAQRLSALQEKLVLFYTGVQRTAHEVLDEQMQRTRNGNNSAVLADMKGLVSQGIRILTSDGDLSEFGTVLHQAWLLKRRLSSKVSSSSIDEIYDRAIRSGAVGGKLLGAGTGGFLLFYVEPTQRQALIEALSALPETPIAFDQGGSQIIFYRP